MTKQSRYGKVTRDKTKPKGEFKLKIICVILAALCIISTTAALRTPPPDELVAMKATVKSVSKTETNFEFESEFEIEIETEDGNIWTMYSSYISAGTNLVVVFYTFESRDLTEWEIVNYYITK